MSSEKCSYSLVQFPSSKYTIDPVLNILFNQNITVCHLMLVNKILILIQNILNKV